MISNWRDAWKWFSVQAMTLVIAAQGAWVALPDDMRASIPVEWVSYGSVVLLVLGVIGRLVDQSK